MGLNESRNMADHSFGFNDEEKGNAETLRGRTSKNNVVDVWMNVNDFFVIYSMKSK